MRENSVMPTPAEILNVCKGAARNARESNANRGRNGNWSQVIRSRESDEIIDEIHGRFMSPMEIDAKYGQVYVSYRR